MKRLLAIFALLVVFIAASAADRTGLIRTGGNILNKMTFGAADTITTSATVTYTITNIQSYQQNFTLTYTLDSLSGDPSVAVTLYGRVTSNGGWTSIGTATWDDVADNPQSISSTSPAHYNWLKVTFVATATTQKTKVLTFDIRTSNAINLPNSSGTLTISRPTSGTVTVQVADDNANAAAIYRAGGNGALTLGAAAGTTAITSSDWAIDATGIATGMGAFTTNGLITGTAGATLSGAVINLNASSNYAVNVGTGSTTATVTVGSGSNTVAFNSAITASAGVALPSASPVIWAQSGAVNAATVGGDSAGVAARRYWVEIQIPYNTTLTGVSYLVGSVGGTDSVVVQLCNSAGVEVATSRNPGTAANLVGTAAQFQAVPFDASYNAVAGKYFIVIQYSGTTAKLRTHSITGCKFVASSAGGTWNTKADITPGTTYTVGKAPFAMTY